MKLIFEYGRDQLNKTCNSITEQFFISLGICYKLKFTVYKNYLFLNYLYSVKTSAKSLKVSKLYL